MFSYKKGSSFLHRCPAWIKILCVPVLGVLYLVLPPFASLVLLALQTVLFFAVGFTVSDLVSDLKPVIYYAALLALFNLVTFVFSGFPAGFWSWDSNRATVLHLVRIFALLQCASVLFKTSTSLQIREGIGVLFGQRSSLANTISMFLNFIPMVGQIWAQSVRAYRARGGKKGVRMFLVLLPVLFSVGMKKAYNSARAVSIRQ